MAKYKKNLKRDKNMKAFIIIALGLFLFTGLVFAVSNGTPKNISIDSETNNIIDSINNETVMRGNITCGETKCNQKMWKGDYNLGEVSVERYRCNEYSESEICLEYNKQGECKLFEEQEIVCIDIKEIKDSKIIEEISKQQEKKLEEIAKAITKRAEKETITIEDHGQIVIEVKD